MQPGDVVIGYVRVSSKHQAKADKASLPTQRERITAYCDAHGLQLRHIYEDHLSGRRQDRPAYQSMLDVCRRGEAKGIVCMFFDRFGRTRKEAERRVWELEEQGIEVVATEEPLPPGDRGLMRTLRLWMAEQESARIAERIRYGVRGKKAKGVTWGRVPYGWQRVGDAMLVCEAEAAVLRRMADLLLTGVSYKAVSLQLNAEGYRLRNGNPWPPSLVGRLLGRPENAGSELLPAILDGATVDACLERLAISRALPRGRSRSSLHLLAGLVRCGGCGRPFVSGGRKHPSGHISRYYWCQGRRDYQDCDAAIVNGPRLEALVCGSLLAAADAAIATAAQEPARPSRPFAAEIALQEAALAAADAHLRRQLQLLERGDLDELQFRVVSREHRAARAAAEQRIAALRAEAAAETRRRAQLASLPQRARGLLETWEAVDVQVRKAALQQLVERVTVSKDGRIELRLRL